jgi:hypothetical protein
MTNIETPRAAIPNTFPEVVSCALADRCDNESAGSTEKRVIVASSLLELLTKLGDFFLGR